MDVKEIQAMLVALEKRLDNIESQRPVAVRPHPRRSCIW